MRASSSSGSSPRPWGRCGTSCLSASVWRFIPTPVGQMPWRSRRGSRPPVHPHARGADGVYRRSGRSRLGSSPRPWGRFAHRPASLIARRFIPTPVGQIPHSRVSVEAWPVHPHARGADVRMGVLVRMGVGSSPRPWGRLGTGLPPMSRFRFIPTPVGQIYRKESPKWQASVHPHARGADVNEFIPIVFPVGSSPRPWGRCRRGRARVKSRGFIPTPVGQMTKEARAEGADAVHPHARGADMTGST